MPGHNDDPLRGLEVINSTAENNNNTQLHICLVAARWNPEINDALVYGARTTLEKTYNCIVTVERVGGCYELPLAVRAVFFFAFCLNFKQHSQYYLLVKPS